MKYTRIKIIYYSVNWNLTLHNIRFCAYNLFAVQPYGKHWKKKGELHSNKKNEKIISINLNFNIIYFFIIFNKFENKFKNEFENEYWIYI